MCSQFEIENGITYVGVLTKYVNVKEVIAMKAYIYIAKMKILSALAYRFDVISSVFVRSLVVVATSYFWIAIILRKMLLVLVRSRC